MPNSPADLQVASDPVSSSQNVSSIREWIGDVRKKSDFELRRIRFSDSQEWVLAPGDDSLRHKSGRFFSIEGLQGRSTFRGLSRFSQPIINQPEVGILGFLVQRREEELHLLVQAKTEPGNINIVQLAPTLQATWSNYSRMHQGEPPQFLDPFLQRKLGSVLIDQLQSEQGSRFLRKRNRNMVLRIADDENLELDERFRWIPLSQMQEFLRQDHLVNTDSRSVIAGLFSYLSERDAPNTDFGRELSLSFREREGRAAHRVVELLAWITEMKTAFKCEIERVPLRKLKGWRVGENGITHESGRYFTIFPAAIQAKDREVTRWDQPLLSTHRKGLCSFVCRRIQGVLHFLVQAWVEPGHLDVVELTTTVHCVPEDESGEETERKHPFFLRVTQASSKEVRLNSVHSEEGGRFYRDEKQYTVILLHNSERLDPPPGYIWMTLGQMMSLIRFNNVFTNEARSMIACLCAHL